MLGSKTPHFSQENQTSDKLYHQKMDNLFSRAVLCVNTHINPSLYYYSSHSLRSVQTFIGQVDQTEVLNQISLPQKTMTK